MTKSRPRIFLSRASLQKKVLGHESQGIGPDEVFSAASSSLRAVTPGKTKKNEKMIRDFLGLEMQRLGYRPLQHPLAIFLDFMIAGEPDRAPTRMHDGDLDNLEKQVLDAMKDVVFKDDRLVVFKVSRKLLSQESMLRISLFEVPSRICSLEMNAMIDHVHSWLCLESLNSATRA